MRWPAIGIACVRGRSMEPTLHEGDRVVVVYGIRPVTGRLAVVRLPDSEAGPRPLAIKRVTGHAPGDPTSWWVERDNPAEGVDSWLVGPISRQHVKGVVVARIPNRLRRLRPPGVRRRTRG
ncbi:S26 family signal peptidase [Lapillicoccus sp.]|uniref:S26 family signal peptidase n=1 Tax=Lapillicoccus sp. TaxID=1909287 RepID=UPI00260083E3|nr:S26 family signal peptidase [Lapillicoccus sp.]